jgi:hypothetical protein
MFDSLGTETEALTFREDIFERSVVTVTFRFMRKICSNANGRQCCLQVYFLGYGDKYRAFVAAHICHRTFIRTICGRSGRSQGLRAQSGFEFVVGRPMKGFGRVNIRTPTGDAHVPGTPVVMC